MHSQLAGSWARPEKLAGEKQAGNPKKAWNSGGTTGVAAAEAVAGDERRRRCQFFHSLGCNKRTWCLPVTYNNRLEPEAKKKALEDCVFCLYCMMHSVETKCF
jgi:hypothetical protein